MAEVDLLRRYPRSKRDVTARNKAKSVENVAIAKRFGREYFDGGRATGYGGYRYDGRWVPIAEDIADHFDLRPGQRVLDVGCAKGFLVKDLLSVVPGLEVFGIDVSDYAVRNAEPEVVGRLHVGNAVDLPFPDGSFDVVLSINTIHNLDREGCIRALREMERVRRGGAYVQVDSYRDERERELFLDWMLTAETHFRPEGWVRLFDAAGYTGDWYWTITE